MEAVIILITTHIHIVNVCYEYCKKKYNIKLDKKSLFWGAIEPDFQKGKNKINHTYSVSVHKLNKLDCMLKDSTLDISYKSKIIGNMAHFIADSFCKYHIEDYYGKSMIKHFLYEGLLEFKLLKMIFFDRDIIDAILNDIEDYGDCFTELRCNRDKYLTIKEHCLNDLYYTIKTTGLLIYKLS